MMKLLLLNILFVVSMSVYAGGNPEYVAYPEDYKNGFTHYHTQNRANNKQIADFYANQIAIESIKKGTLEIGSVIVMEIFKPQLNEEEKPVTASNGLFIKEKLAAIAVMEKQDNWDVNFLATDRAGQWGFALYDTAGAPKSNELECASCHIPLKDQNYLFSINELRNHPH